MTSSQAQLRISEIFSSIQGEGIHVGKAARFLRLANCNLRCTFCDTKYTWDWANFDKEAEVTLLEVAEIQRRLDGAAHLVITGGEPLLQQEGVGTLLESLPSTVFIEVETNGTLAPLPVLRDRVNQWNLSPKLSNSGEPETRRVREDVLSEFRALENSYLKFVVDGGERVQEALQLIDRLRWPKERVLLMPQAQTPEELLERQVSVAQACSSLGLRFSPRLHVQLWGQQRGV